MWFVLRPDLVKLRDLDSNQRPPRWNPEKTRRFERRGSWLLQRLHQSAGLGFALGHVGDSPAGNSQGTGSASQSAGTVCRHPAGLLG